VFADDVEGLVSFLREVFDAKGEFRAAQPSEMVIGDSMLLVSGTTEREAFAAFLYVYVDDVDATYRRATGAGAEVIEEPRDLPYGDRRATVSDAWGNTWQIAARL
jgi:uncharacterized glyoxalase superfamily protein PhnB